MATAILTSEASMASTTTLRPNPSPEMSFYMLGMPVPSGTFPKSFVDSVLATAKQQFSNIIPTTYEASKAYLDQELLKPAGQRNLHKEMCMIIVSVVPDNQDVYLKNDSVGYLVALKKGTMLFAPTVDNPPTAFGTLENQSSSKLVNKKSAEPPRALIALAYFTTEGDRGLNYVGNIENKVRVNRSPYR